MARAKKKDRIFTDRERKLFRKRIPSTESIFGAGFLAFVIGMGSWFFAQKNNFDPSERDISNELMVADSVEDKLFRMPLERWTEPGQGGVVSAAADTGYFPEAILEHGWQPSTRPQEFVADNLYEKINGAAPQYIDFGFQKLYYIGLVQPATNAEISIEMYDMGEFQNALGIFAAQRDASRDVINRGHAYFYETSLGAIGIAGTYYFKIAGAEPGPEIEKKTQYLIDALCGLKQAQIGTPTAFQAFAGTMGIPFQNIQYQRTDVFQYDFAKDFWFAAPADGDGMRYYVHETPDESAAGDLYNKLLENHLMDYEQTAEREGGVVLKHKYLDEYLVLEKRGSMIYGLDGAPSIDSVDGSLSKLETVIFHEES
ncbi:MAG: hypothetical protein GC168_07540 [Candidatus Hydrogenedens sp.]|nr:hypothetical protein [Candidatus Hydrogenedens sp.]